MSYLNRPRMIQTKSNRQPITKEDYQSKQNTTRHPFFDPVIQSIAKSCFKLRMKKSYLQMQNPYTMQKNLLMNSQSVLSSSDYCFYASQTGNKDAVQNSVMLEQRNKNKEDAVVIQSIKACPGQDLADIALPFKQAKLTETQQSTKKYPYQQLHQQPMVGLTKRVNFTQESSSTQRAPQQFLIQQPQTAQKVVTMSAERVSPNKLKKALSLQYYTERVYDYPGQDGILRASEVVIIDENSARLNANASEHPPKDTLFQSSVDFHARTDTSIRSDSVEEMQALLHNANGTQPTNSAYGQNQQVKGFNQPHQSGIIKQKLSMGSKMRRNVLSKLSKRDLSANEDITYSEATGGMATPDQQSSALQSAKRNLSMRESPLLKPNYMQRNQGTLGNDQHRMRIEMNFTNSDRYERPLAKAMTLQKKDTNKLVINAKEVVDKTLISHFNTQSKQILQEVLNSSSRIKTEQMSRSFHSTLMNQSLRKTQAQIKNGTVINNEQKDFSKKSVEKHTKNLRRKYSLPYAKFVSVVQKQQNQTKPKIQASSTPPVKILHSNTVSNASSDLVPPFTFNPMQGSRFVKKALTSQDFLNQNDFLRANMEEQKIEQNNVLVGESLPNAISLQLSAEQDEQVSKSPNEVQTKPLTTHQQFSEQSHHQSSNQVSNSHNANIPSNARSSRNLKIDQTETAGSQYRADIHVQQKLKLQANKSSGLIVKSERNLQNNRQEDKVNRENQSNNDLKKEQVMVVEQRSRQNFNVKIASNKIKAQRVDQTAPSQSQRQVQKEQAPSAPAVKQRLTARRDLKHNASKETLGTNSQGSQANFAPLPSFSKFGLERPSKNPSNINILDLLQMPASDKTGRAINNCSRRAREAQNTRPTVYPGLLPQKTLENSRRSHQTHRSIRGQNASTSRRPSTTVAYHHYRGGQTQTSLFMGQQRQPSIVTEASSDQYDLTRQNKKQLVQQQQQQELIKTQQGLNNLVMNNSSGGMDIQDAKQQVELQSEQSRMPIPSTYQMTQPTLNVVTTMTTRNNLQYNIGRTASAGVIVTRRHNNTNQIMDGNISGRVQNNAPPVSSQQQFNNSHGGSADVAIQPTLDVSQRSLADMMFVSEAYQTVQQSNCANQVSKAVKQKNMLTLIKQGKQSQVERKGSLTVKSTQQNSVLADKSHTMMLPNNLKSKQEKINTISLDRDQQAPLFKQYTLPYYHSQEDFRPQQRMSTAPAGLQNQMMTGSEEMGMDGAGATTQVNWDMPSSTDQLDEHTNPWLMTNEGHPNILADKTGFSTASGFNLFRNTNQGGLEDNYGMIVNNGIDATSGLLVFPTHVSQFQTLNTPAAKRVKSANINLYQKNKKMNIKRGQYQQRLLQQNQVETDIVSNNYEVQSLEHNTTMRGLDNNNFFRQLTIKSSSKIKAGGGAQVSINKLQGASKIKQRKLKSKTFVGERKSNSGLQLSTLSRSTIKGGFQRPFKGKNYEECSSKSPVQGSAIMLHPRPVGSTVIDQQGNNQVIMKNGNIQNSLPHMIRLRNPKQLCSKKNRNGRRRNQNLNNHNSNQSGLRDYHEVPSSRQFSTVKKNQASREEIRGSLAMNFTSTENNSGNHQIRQTQTLSKDDELGIGDVRGSTPPILHMNKKMRDSINQVQDLIQEIQVPIVEVVMQNYH